MEITLSISHQGQTSQFKTESGSILIGRSREADVVDIDLHNDPRVSRRHARLTWENNKFWLEDLGSRHGTKLNGTEIKGTGKHLFEPLGEALIGDTKLRFELHRAAVVANLPDETPAKKSAGVTVGLEAGGKSRESERASLEQVLEVLSRLPLRDRKRHV